MKKNLSSSASLTISLSIVLLAAGLAAIISAAMMPNIILPALTIPTLAGLSLAALALETLVFGSRKHFWAASLVLSAVVFGVLTLCAGFVPSALEAGRVALLGGGVFLVCEVLYSSILERLGGGKLSAVLTAPVLWLAVQSLAGIGL